MKALVPTKVFIIYDVHPHFRGSGIKGESFVIFDVRSSRVCVRTLNKEARVQEYEDKCSSSFP